MNDMDMTTLAVELARATDSGDEFTTGSWPLTTSEEWCPDA